MKMRSIDRSGRRRALRHGTTVLLSVLAILVLAAFTSRANAHHSFSVFDMETEKELEGKVVEFQWTNPHTWTWLDVTNADGSVTRWGLEGMSPDFLGRRGWTKNTFRPGDTLKVVIAPLKSGEAGGTLMRATLPDGTQIVKFGRAPGG